MIYAIKAEGTVFIKFGKAASVGKRLKELETASPHELTIIDKLKQERKEANEVALSGLYHAHAQGQIEKRRAERAAWWKAVQSQQYDGEAPQQGPIITSPSVDRKAFSLWRIALRCSAKLHNMHSVVKSEAQQNVPRDPFNPGQARLALGSAWVPSSRVERETPVE